MITGACESSAEPRDLSDAHPSGRGDEGSTRATWDPELFSTNGDEPAFAIEVELSYPTPLVNNEIPPFPISQAFAASFFGLGSDHPRMTLISGTGGGAGRYHFATNPDSPTLAYAGAEPLTVFFERANGAPAGTFDRVEYRELSLRFDGLELSGKASAEVRYAHADYFGGRSASATLRGTLRRP